MGNVIRVLVVDDSALVRKMLTAILNSDPNIEVVGTASDPFVAREKIKKLNPDVLTLDVEMPKMDGITFLKNLMRLRPMPVLMISSLTDNGAAITLKALEYGAVDYISKPKIDLSHSLEDCSEQIIAKLKMAAGVRVKTLIQEPVKKIVVEEKYSADAVIAKISTNRHFSTTDSIVAIGASTGGTEAIKEILRVMPASAPGMVIVQHIPGAFSGPFAARVNEVSEMNVCEAQNGQQVLPGHAYIAPGDSHLLLVRNGARYQCKLCDELPVNRHKPAVDVLFRSAAQNAGPNAMGVLLTGMGEDGAQGLKEMQEAGASTIAQDNNTSVVWGMPGAAVKLGAVDTELPLGKIASAIMSNRRQPKKRVMATDNS